MSWISNLFGSAVETPDGAVDKRLLLAFRHELDAFDALYRQGADLARRACPESIGQDPQAFSEFMLELHRDLLVKIFVEIAHVERNWTAEEKEVALVLLKHVWEMDVMGNEIELLLQHVTEQAEKHSWEKLVRPFVKLPPLSELIPSFRTRVLRIANLIAKADGCILPAEVAALKHIQSSIDNALTCPVKAAQSCSKADVRRDHDSSQNLKVQAAHKTAGDKKTQSAKNTTKEPPPDREARDKMLAEAMAELDNLIGLAGIKKDVHQLINFLKVQDERLRHGLQRDQVSLHTIFRGNPGTGKTTVARIIGRALGGLAILQKGHTVETDRSGLVAEYVGQTGPRVNQRLDEALDGVLFIDEAYSLVPEREDSFSSEAVQVLLKRMEDDRERLVVILAGYPAPMKRMIRSNPGLSSRFQRTFDFPDYSVDELVQVFCRMCEKNQYVIVDSVREKLKSFFVMQVAKRDEHFGNARLARNLFEQAIRRLADRIVSSVPITRELLTNFHPDDIDLEMPS